MLPEGKDRKDWKGLWRNASSNARWVKQLGRRLSGQCLFYDECQVYENHHDIRFAPLLQIIQIYAFI
jgi:hypothetical protein